MRFLRKVNLLHVFAAMNEFANKLIFTPLNLNNSLSFANFAVDLTYKRNKTENCAC